MARRLGLALALALPLLAGCLGGGPGDLLDEEDPRTKWPLQVDDCGSVAATVPVDKPRVQRALPLGFEAVDSGGTFGGNRESGRTNLTLVSLACEDGTVAGEDVEIPSLALPLVRVHPVDALEGSVDATFYAFTVHGEDPELRATLQEMGHEDNRSKVFANVTSSPLGDGAEATVTGGDTLYRIRSGAGNPADRYQSFRVYHKGDRGLLVLDGEWTGDGPVDGSAQLEANEGSRLARFMDSPREPAYGVVRSGTGLDATWHLAGGEGAD